LAVLRFIFPPDFGSTGPSFVLRSLRSMADSGNVLKRGEDTVLPPEGGDQVVGTVWPCASLDSPPWQVRQNCAALLLVFVFPGSYQPRTKKCVGLITAAVVVVPATAMNWVMSCWSWQVVQVTHELLVYDVYGAVPTPVPGTLTRFAIGPVLVTS